MKEGVLLDSSLSQRFLNRSGLNRSYFHLNLLCEGVDQAPGLGRAFNLRTVVTSGDPKLKNVPVFVEVPLFAQGYSRSEWPEAVHQFNLGNWVASKTRVKTPMYAAAFEKRLGKVPEGGVLVREALPSDFLVAEYGLSRYWNGVLHRTGDDLLLQTLATGTADLHRMGVILGSVSLDRVRLEFNQGNPETVFWGFGSFAKLREQFLIANSDPIEASVGYEEEAVMDLAQIVAQVQLLGLSKEGSSVIELVSDVYHKQRKLADKSYPLSKIFLEDQLSFYSVDEQNLIRIAQSQIANEK